MKQILKRGGKIRIIQGWSKELNNARKEVYRILGDLKLDPEFVRFIKIEFDRNFDIDDMLICELRDAYKCIRQYRRLFLKEV